MSIGDNDPEIPLPTNDDDSDLNDTSIRQRVAYDEFIGAEQGEVSLEASDAEFAKFVRLMHDTLGARAKPSPKEARLGQGATTRPSLANPFGRFEHLHLIGSGSFGSVWRATDPALQREVAIKVPHPEVRLVPQLALRFLRESRAAARLNHPSIVRIHEAGVIDGVPYMVSEYVAGETLSDRLRRERRLATRAAARIVAQLADAAEHAHRSGVVHRDIKPDNVLMQHVDGQSDVDVVARLTDFGLARLADENTDHSRAGLLVGTPNYMAPEQLSGSEQARDATVDVYSLGVVLYELIAGNLPRQANGSVQTLLTQSHQIKRLRRQHLDVPRDLDAICMHCLEVNPEDRYRSAASLSDDLNRYLDGRPTAVRPLRPIESFLRLCRDHRAAAAVLATIFTALCIISTLTWRTSVAAEHQNQRLRTALATGEQARQSAIDSEHRYREISWNTGIQHVCRTFDEGDFMAAQQMLDQLVTIHADYRTKPEWNLLSSELANRYSVLHQVDVPLRDVVPIGQTGRVAIAGETDHLEILDVGTGKIHDRIQTTLRQSHALGVESSGQRIAVGGTANVFNRTSPVLIDLQTHQIRPSPISGPTTIESLSWSPSGKFLAAGFRYNGIALAGVADSAGKPIRLTGDRRNLTIQWTDQEDLVVQRDVRTLDVVTADGTMKQQITRDGEFQVFATLANEPKVVAAYWVHRDLEVIDLERNQTDFKLAGATHLCTSIGCADDGRWIAAGGADGQIVLWRLPAGSSKHHLESNGDVMEIEPLAKYQVHTGSITALCWINDWIVSVGEDGRVVRTDVGELGADVADQVQVPQVTAAKFFPKSRELLIGFQNGEIWRVDAPRLWESGLKNRLPNVHRQCQQHGRSVRAGGGIEIVSLAVSQDSRHYAMGQSDGLFQVIQFADNDVRFTYRPAHAANVAWHFIDDLGFSPSGEAVYWTTDDHVLHGHAFNNSASWHQPLGSDIECLRLSPDGHRLAVGGMFEGLRLYGLQPEPGLLRTLGINSNPVFQFTESGQELIAGCRDGTIRVYAMATGKEPLVLKPHLSQVCGLCVSRDNKFGVSIDNQTNVMIWNRAAGLVYGRLQKPRADEFEYSHFRGFSMMDDSENLLMMTMIRRRDQMIDSQVQLFRVHH